MREGLRSSVGAPAPIGRRAITSPPPRQVADRDPGSQPAATRRPYRSSRCTAERRTAPVRWTAPASRRSLRRLAAVTRCWTAAGQIRGACAPRWRRSASPPALGLGFRLGLGLGLGLGSGFLACAAIIEAQSRASCGEADLSTSLPLAWCTRAEGDKASPPSPTSARQKPCTHSWPLARLSVKMCVSGSSDISPTGALGRLELLRLSWSWSYQITRVGSSTKKRRLSDAFALPRVGHRPWSQPFLTMTTPASDGSGERSPSTDRELAGSDVSSWLITHADCQDLGTYDRQRGLTSSRRWSACRARRPRRRAPSQRAPKGYKKGPFTYVRPDPRHARAARVKFACRSACNGRRSRCRPR